MGAGWTSAAAPGALTEEILAHGEPSEVLGVDPAHAFVEYTAAHVTDLRASFRVAEAQALPVDDGSVDAVVSGLVLNFLPDPTAALRDMRRATRNGGAVAAYV